VVGMVQLSKNWGCRTGFCGPLAGGVCKQKQGVHLDPELFFSKIL